MCLQVGVLNRIVGRVGSRGVLLGLNQGVAESWNAELFWDCIVVVVKWGCVFQLKVCVDLGMKL